MHINESDNEHSPDRFFTRFHSTYVCSARDKNLFPGHGRPLCVLLGQVIHSVASGQLGIEDEGVEWMKQK